VHTLHASRIGHTADVVAFVQRRMSRMCGTDLGCHRGIILERPDATVGFDSADCTVQVAACHPVAGREWPPAHIEGIVLQDRRSAERASHGNPVVGE
jgi:hypothetical protein